MDLLRVSCPLNPTAFLLQGFSHSALALPSPGVPGEGSQELGLRAGQSSHRFAVLSDDVEQLIEHDAVGDDARVRFVDLLLARAAGATLP